MSVREIMKSPAPQVSVDAIVGDVARAVLDGSAEGVIVVDTDGTLAGIITERDLVERHARPHAPVYLGILGTILPFDTHRTDEDMRHILGVTARDLMTEDPVTLEADATVEDAATLMLDKHANPLVVMEGDTVAGLVSHADIVRLLIIEESDDAVPADA